MITPGKLVSVSSTGNEILKHGTKQFPAAAYLNDYASSYACVHWHKELELIYVEKGSLLVTIPGTRLLLIAGETVFINSEVLHGASNAERGSKCLLHSAVFSPDFLSGGQTGCLWENYIGPLIQNDALPYLYFKKGTVAADHAAELIDLYWQAMEKEAVGFEFYAREALCKMMLTVLDTADHVERIYLKESNSYKRIHLMLQFISDHYSQDIHVSDIAASASVSESECLRCFQDQLHTAPGQYLIQYRLKQAADQLIHSDSSVSQIAKECGFHHMSYFSRRFEKEFGLVPSAYRIKNQASIYNS